MNFKKYLCLCIGLICLSLSAYSQQDLKPTLESEAGDFYGPDYRYGIVLTSPNGTCYRIRVLDNGNVITEDMACPGVDTDCVQEDLNLETDALGAQNQNITHGNFTGVSGWVPAKAGDNNSTKIVLDGNDSYSSGEIYTLTTTESRAKVSYMLRLEEDWVPTDGLILPGLSAIDNGPISGGLANGGAGYGDGNSSMPADQQKSWSARGFISPATHPSAPNALGYYIYHSNHNDYPAGDNDWWGNGLLETIPQAEAQLVASQWYNIEQEVVLNDVGQSNGELRGWIDGTLLYERTNLHFTDNPAYRTIAFNTNTNKPTDNLDQAEEILFGPWVQPYGHKGQDGTWPVITDDPNYQVNWMHMHRTKLDPESPWYIITMIEDAREAGMHMSLQIGEEAMYAIGVNHNFQWDLWTEMIDEVAAGPEGIAIQEALDDGTIESIYLMDEPHTTTHWKPAVSNSTVDNMGQYVKSKWPNAKTSVRAPLRFLEFGHRGAHDFQYVDYSYITWSFIQWSNWGASNTNNRKGVEWHWERNFAPYANQSLMKPRIMLQQGRGTRYENHRRWTPFGYSDPNFDWFEETGAGETDLFAMMEENAFVYWNDSPDNLDYGAMGALQKRDPITGALDPVNGEILVDCIGLFRWDRNGGSNPDSGNGTVPMPYTDIQVIRDTYYGIRDKIAAGPPYVARLIERHPEWEHHLDPYTSYDPSTPVPAAEDCEIFLDCADFQVGDNCGQ